ncbi:glycosyltransferase [Clostridium baratii]|uniref:glycosyltransferase n=1 Tax=Clostridium baratii TaxID=1561 RepID=UPI0006BAAF6A|nr:glycosyltransferase [Clostridium baratii]
MSLAPIVLFTFNRLEHTKKTIESLKENILAEESELFIFSDGARNSNEEEKVNEVRKYIRKINGFKKINIIESKNNKGLARSVINGVTDIINNYNKVIVLEDDLITSKYFLQYMNDALDMFESRGDIWSISGYSPKIEIPCDYKDETYITKRGSSWGWATWKEKWKLVDWNIVDYNSFKTNRKSIKEFNMCGKDLAPMLEDQIKGRIDSWAIRWVYNQYKNNMWTVYPINSFVKNIGNDLSGTHTNTKNTFNVELNKKKIILNYNITVNKILCNNFKVIYDQNFSGYTALFIKRIGLYRQVRKYRNNVIKILQKYKR